MKEVIESSKKGKKIFLRILIILLILIIVWFFVYNGKQIRNGRRVKAEDLISQEYQSKDESVYLYFLNNETIYFKLKNEEEIVNALTFKFIINDGLITAENDENQKYVILSKGQKIFDLSSKKTLYILNN